MTVFVVDDSNAFRDRLRRMLTDAADIEIVGEAGDGASALSAIARLRPDAILLDLHMRGVHGFDVLRQLRSQLQETIVIVLTSDATASVRQRCAVLGAHAVIDKGDAAENVLPTLRRLAHNRGL